MKNIKKIKIKDDSIKKQKKNIEYVIIKTKNIGGNK